MNRGQKNVCYLFLMLFVLVSLGQMFGWFHVSDHYHKFVDERIIFSIPRFADTVSNLGFLVIGMIFLKEMLLKNEKDHNLKVIVVGTILICFGSGYYHLSPENSRLLLDRLPISMVFAGVLSYSLHQNQLIKESWKKSFDTIYLLFSVLSVLIWYIGSLKGQDWLSMYVFVQFGGMIILIYIALIGKNKEFNKKIMYVLMWYVLAKVCEHFDQYIYNITSEMMSGHTLKHIFSAIALYQWFPKEKKEKYITEKDFK